MRVQERTMRELQEINERLKRDQRMSVDLDIHQYSSSIASKYSNINKKRKNYERSTRDQQENKESHSYRCRHTVV